MIDFSAGDEYGDVSCDFCSNSYEGFYALTEEEFIDEMLRAGWQITSDGQCKCETCQMAEGVAMYLRAREEA